MDLSLSKKQLLEGNEEERLNAQIQKLEQFIEEAPREFEKQIEHEQTFMPPPDDLDDRRREKELIKQLGRGEVRNEHRHQARSVVLFILLAAATASVAWWIFSVLKQASVL